MARKYHSTTTYFNYYYNGELKWQEGVDQINAAYRVPPEGYIEVMYAGTEDDSKTYADNFEQAIEKAEIALQKHNQKDNRWFDNCRYLIGRSWYYKRSYVLAIKNFEHIIEKWPQSKVIPDVYLWLVKTHYMDGNNAKALKILEEKVNKLDLSKRQKGEKALIQAQVLLDEGRYEEVIRILNRHKKDIKGKNNRARVYFLKGQLYSEQGSFAKAFEAYKKVTKINTDYELIFNAKLNTARLMIAQEGGSDGNTKLLRFLKKMLRDEKNIDYKDQVYYEMAMVYYKQKDYSNTIDHLKYSVQNNTNNQRQKALSYYKVGQIYFYDLKDFQNAGLYFDSASTSITRDAPEYAEISAISKTLKEYVGHINAIELNDSLLALSKLTDQQLERRVDDILEAKRKKEEEEKEKRLEELDRLNDPNLFSSVSTQGNRRSGFYFDNPDQVNSGRSSFQQVWGNRKNEDNWRRKNKTIFNQTEEALADTVQVSEEEIEKYGSAEKAKLIKSVPRTDEEIAILNNKVVFALYGLGQVYENKLVILDSAVAVYKRLVRRYPEEDYSLKARYALYKIYKDKLEQPDKATRYENEICGKYPDSRLCRIIQTGVVEDDSPKFEDLNSAYDALHTTYKDKDYPTCVDFANFIVMQHPTSELLAEVFFIKGKSFGYMGKQDSLKAIYNYVKLNYPESDVIPEVNRTLAFLNGVAPEDIDDGPDNNNTNPTAADDIRYKGFTTERRSHEKVYIVMLVKKDKIKSNDLQQKLNGFNRQYFQEKRLNVSIFLYKNQSHLPYISQFKDEQTALSYIRDIMKEPGIAELFTEENEKVVFITPKNFRTAYGKKRFEDYFLYYENVVLKSLDGN